MRVKQSTADCGTDPKLIIAVYAKSTWNGIMSAQNCFAKFAMEKNVPFAYPIPKQDIYSFINWAILERKMSPNTVKTYLHNLSKLHRLKNLDDSNCKNFLTKTMLRGAENLIFYEEQNTDQRLVMTLPLLRILGHGLSTSDYSVHSKFVIWTSFCVAFYGSFRFGELLSKHEKSTTLTKRCFGRTLRSSKTIQ